MIYVLCHPLLEAAAGKRIEAFRRRHDPERARLVPAHVTLVFGVGGIAPEPLIADIAAIAARTPAFAISLDRAEAHAGVNAGESHLFLMVGRGAAELDGLNEALYAGRLAAQRRHDLRYVAHMTIATSASRAAIATAEQDAGGLGLPLQGHVDRLHIVSLNGGVLHPLAEVPLQAAP